MTKVEEKVFYSSDEAAKQITVTGWVSRDGRFWGKDEHMARYSGCTHTICDCGNEMGKSWTKCESCRHKAEWERYNKMPYKEWDGVTPVCSDDKYFFSSEEIDEYLEENELNPEDLGLIICEENYYNEIDTSIWEDVIPEDGEPHPELEKKINELNKFIRTLPAASWGPGKYRTSYRPQNSPQENQSL